MINLFNLSKSRIIKTTKSTKTPNKAIISLKPRHHFLKTLLTIFLASLLLIQPTSALSDELLDYYNINGIYYYNPSGNNAGYGCYNGTVTISGSTPEEKIWSGLISFMTPEQAAGVMGNMAHEGNYFNPVQHEVSQMNKYWGSIDIVTDASVPYGIGLIQWSWGRRVNLLQHIQNNAPDLLNYFLQPELYSIGYTINGRKLIELVGETVYDQLIQIELDYLKIELENNNTYKKIFDQPSVEAAADYFLYYVEAPADPEASRSVRRQDAQKYYDDLYGATLSPSAGGGCPASGSLQELVTKYAWPEYKGQDFTQQMPDYTATIQQRVSQKLYVGGNNGNDCGGFVTTLMQESGFAPDYNYGGRIDQGASNVPVQEQWVQENGWTLLNGSPSAQIDTNLLQPGDVAFVTGHTFVYVGNIPGFDSVIASASYSADPDRGRSPMAGRESLTYDSERGEIVRWYRKSN